ncbi:MAG: heterodisulfide reductase-related iron-sulfur binding cluster [Marmoricola sp.]
MLQHFAQVVSLVIAVVGIALFVKAIRQILGVLRTGQATHRTDRPGQRTATMLKESLGHTRMLQWTWMGAGHWFVFIGFGLLFFTLVTAFGQLFDSHFAIPFLGDWFLFEWVSELFTLVMLVAIVAFIGYRATRPKERTRGVKGRFFGSTMWQGYFVELVILGVGLCIVLLRGAEFAQAKVTGHADIASAFHYPFSIAVGQLMDGWSAATLANVIYVVAMIKIVISFVWMITISLQPTMGVAWHRFLAFFNIWFRREPDGRTALGALKPMTANGEVINLEDLEEIDEDTKLGVGSIEDFAWKGILDFTTCTECGRCQSQCPAWNTDKPLSPKMVMLNLRNHAHMKAPYLQASEDERASLPQAVLTEAERPLVGSTEGFAWGPDPVAGSAVIDDDVLWSCTTCGACVQQCPVDIEHVDHIVDMRRYQVLVESNFPSELNGLFKGMESKGNPWNMNPNGRLEWAQGLDFPVKVVGEDVEDLADVDWLFWVGCAGAYEDRAKKTTRAVAELLNMAGVDFAVLGNGETCTGDPARRAGNEFVFQGLASQNAETFKETKAKKVVATCAHCFNTLKNEYSQFGVELEVVHHTQLLNRLVREKKLTPVAATTVGGPGAQPPVSGQGAKRLVTYHDPCYLGRHNQVYSPPRELLEIIPDADFTEMPRNSERSFCCGAGGARMWMEEKIGERINRNRTKEAVATGADQIAVGCPFCRVMLSDGLVAEQQDGNAREEVEILDVAQLLLASVKGEPPTKAKVPAGAAAKAGEAASGTAAASVATQDEPEAGDVTQSADTVTRTEDVGADAKAHTGGSLFDAPATEAPQDPTDPPEVGGSLFDLGGGSSEPTAPKAASEEADSTQADSTQAEPAKAEPAKPAASSGGGSLFDIAAPEPSEQPAQTEQKQAEPEQDEPAASEATTPATASAPAPSGEIGGGSLFDIAAPEPAQPAPTAAQPERAAAEQAEPEEPAAEKPAAEKPTAEKPAADIGSGSLFDIAAPEQPAPSRTPEPVAAESEAVEPEKEEADQSDQPEPAEAEAETKTGADAAETPIRSLKDIKAEHSGQAEATEPQEHTDAGDDAEANAEAPAEAEQPAADGDRAAPASLGEAHQPKTDADIGTAGSLFDL